MNEIRQFVYDILDAKEERANKDDKGDLQRWIAAAELPTSPHETPVSEALTELTSASQRALLLAVAMLHGAHADVIDGAASALVASLPGAPDAALDRSPLGERLREVGAEADTARHMASGFAAQCLDARYQRYWTALVERLTEQRSNPARELAAAAVLQVGLEDEANSRTFRRQIYNWSRASGTSGSLATVLVVACQQMTRTHSGEALVRLHHLARWHPERTDIWDALADVVYSNRPLLRLLLSRLAGRPFEMTRTVDARIFLHVADPSRLTARQPTNPPPITQSDVARQLAAGWALAFTRLPGTEWASRASDWLRCAAEDETNRHPLLNVLIEGGRPATAVLPQLYGLAHTLPRSVT